MTMNQQELHALLEYNPSTGDMIWKHRSLDMFASEGMQGLWNSRFAGKIAGSLTADGYRQVRILSKRYLIHRMIWIHVHGDTPDEIDHINGDKLDNRITNLRSVTKSTNQRNAKQWSTNRSGYSGVSWCSRVKKWRSTAQLKGKTHSIGSFSCKLKARDAVLAFQQEQGGYTARHGVADL